ncbi:MAG: hypothetical protein JST89_00510 [Cyanobacteria bacterium SZAS-4]|nr:hypothetical protein [Cyanobacteria bacterium SZAS-4]
MNQKQTHILIALGLALLSQSTCESAYAKAKATKAVNENIKSSSAEQQEIAVRNVLIALEKALSSKGEGAGLLFAENALHIDQAGEEIRGRAALQARFDEQLKTSAAAIGLHPESITFPAENVALVVGEVSRKQEETYLPTTRFSMVMVKITGSWLINQVTETAMQAAQMESRLQQLDWLIGTWSTDKSDSSAEMKVEWSPQGKKFITSKYTLNKTGKSPQIDSHVIGWDPQRRCIVSWHFDSNGGFGTGIWSKQPNENTWKVDFTGVAGDGSNMTANNTFSQKSTDEFVWQSTHRSLDGVAIADTDPITVRRIKL